jgi:uncharacterized protein with PQ loop repeat
MGETIMDFLLPAIGFVAMGVCSLRYCSSDQGVKNKEVDDISLRFIVVLIIGLSFWVIVPC